MGVFENKYGAHVTVYRIGDFHVKFAEGRMRLQPAHWEHSK